ncbi:thioredoxin-disulfide reductase [Candidatus Acetothermia bacterium]|nr:MAG: thioredoxin-disulfide reductase [Candidatus Acetothermia bacterium]
MPEEKPHDVIIIVAGPAGLTAAIYTGRALLPVLVIEKAVPGGQLNETDLIENWPGFEEAVAAPELMEKLRRQAARFGAEIVQDEVIRIEPGEGLHRVVTPHGLHTARTVILAPGSRPRELPAKGAARLKGRGVSYCATCDGFFFQGKRIIEVGAGDSGLTEALFLTRFAESVKIVIRHPEDDPKAFRASPILQKRARENPKISFLWNRIVEEVLGEDRVTGVILRNLATGETETLEIDGVFVNIGHVPQTDFLKGAVNLDDDGYIVTDKRLRTSIPGIFAAGDARIDANRYAQGVIAAGEGAIAAIEAEKYLSG